MATNPKITLETINELHLPRMANILMLLVWITAGIGIMLPFALGTSPLDALLLRVPNNEGNWWHALVGLPFFLSLPMIWLHLRLLNSEQLPALFIRRALWISIIFSVVGTLLVEAPFLLHRAGTSGLQRLEVIFSGLGIILISGIFLFVKRKNIHPTRACFIGIAAAYLANAFLCLIVYGETKFNDQSRSGWYVTLVVVLPMLIELIWLLFRKSDMQINVDKSF
ncbi:MAG: hypothetical protein JWR38_4744 [Mucilaginibacter sp.]|nr:hypothetical protein [Mucilaginibacter sp.]